MTANVRLMPLRVEQHAPLIRALIEEPENAYRFRGLGPGSPEGSVERVLRDPALLSQFLLVDRQDQLVGLVQAILPDFKHGTCQFAIVVQDALHHAGWPLKGALLALENLFHTYPLRKVYIEVNELNDKRLGRGLATVFDREGTLSDYEWHDGAYRDVTYWSVTRDRFMSLPLRRFLLERADAV